MSNAVRPDFGLAVARSHFQQVFLGCHGHIIRVQIYRFVMIQSSYGSTNLIRVSTAFAVVKGDNTITSALSSSVSCVCCGG